MPITQLEADVQAMQLLGHGDPAEPHGEAGGERDEIEPPAGEQADRGRERDEFERRHERQPSAG
jgi:hypothetical protein